MKHIISPATVMAACDRHLAVLGPTEKIPSLLALGSPEHLRNRNRSRTKQLRDTARMCAALNKMVELDDADIIGLAGHIADVLERKK